jgi:hypothetical protein
MNRRIKAMAVVALLVQCAVLQAQQVQRMFLGCAFGEKMEVVLDSLQSRGIKVVACKDALVIDAAKKPLTYNGVTWNYVCLNFFDNQFYTISFTSDDTQKKRAEIKTAYAEMRANFARRYKDNMLYNVDEGLRIHDGFTGVFCHIDCVDEEGNRANPESGKMRIFLTYTDEKIDQVKRVLDE